MKSIVKLFSKELKFGSTVLIFLMNFTSGIGAFLFVKFLNKYLDKLINNETIVVYKAILIFSVIILSIAVSRRIFVGILSGVSTRLLWNLRREMVGLMLNPNFAKLKQTKQEIYSVLLTDARLVGNSVITVTNFTTSAILAISCLIYLFFLSWQLAALTFVVSIIGIFIYTLTHGSNHENFRVVRKLEDGFVSKLNEILAGYKEFFMDLMKREGIIKNYFVPISNKSSKSYVKAVIGFQNNLLIGQSLYYTLIVAIILLRQDLNISVGVVVSFILTLLFLLGSLQTIMSLVTPLSKAVISADKILELEAKLKKVAIVEEKQVKLGQLNTLELKDITYEYQTEYKDFYLGPISISINKGESIFIYGGNGSGKTTLMYTLLGLLSYKDGNIQINSKSVVPENSSAFRNYFSVVFSDFYLFESNYSDKPIDSQKALYYIQLFELEDKVAIKDNTFTTVDLSMGQRKRLALINAILEERPILILDEWAADQDPHFRNKFYHDIVPHLIKAENKTIIAITHDDRYFHLADRLFKMEYGKIHEVNPIEIKNIF